MVAVQLEAHRCPTILFMRTASRTDLRQRGSQHTRHVGLIISARHARRPRPIRSPTARKRCASQPSLVWEHHAERETSSRSFPWRPRRRPSPPPCAAQGTRVRGIGPDSPVRSSAGRHRRAEACRRPWPRRASRRARRRSRCPRGRAREAGPRRSPAPARSRSTRTCSRPLSPPSPPSAPSSSTRASDRCSGSSTRTASCTRRSSGSSSSPASQPPGFCGSRPCKRRTGRPRSRTAETASCS